ncbi:DUF6088 family protein [Duffyella gerundensis]|uniref:DUF6088 family protein n=1 Tax=Duffyella TaxID=3026546 RepID=UPI003F6DC274
MSIQQQVARQVAATPPGKIIVSRDFPAWKSAPNSLSKALSRLVASGELARFAKGQFYRPKTGMFGQQQPTDSEKLRPLLFENGKRTGYITSFNLYSRFGLTTQLPMTVTIARNGSRQNKNLGNFSVKIIPSKAPITEDNIPYLEILDVVRTISQIPDTSVATTIVRLRSLIQNNNNIKIENLINTAIAYYPPATRFILAKIIASFSSQLEERLRKSLNPGSRFRIT